MIEHIVPKVPTYFIRYEDLRLNPRDTLEKVFAFLLGVESVEGLNIQRRISAITELGHKVSVSYAQKIESHDLKDEDKKPIVFNRSISEFSLAQRELLANTLSDYMHIFNYCSKAEDGASLFDHNEKWL